MSILKEILKFKKLELSQAKNDVPLSELKARIQDAESTRDLGAAIRREQGGPVKLIAELKKASPSKGMIRSDFSLSEIVSIYDKKNVAAISVLTERRFFSGKLSYLGKARKRTEKPLLRKDFIFDDYQIYESRANYADAVLLIASALEKSRLADLHGLAQELSLHSLLEVHNYHELDTALYCGAKIIGINNRDLNTLNISLNITLDMIKDIPDDIVVVSESGIHSRADVEALESRRIDAVLIGTSIMQSRDIGARIDELMGEGS